MSNDAADKFEHELEHAVFLSLYNSSKQRLLRLSGITLITAKHGVRGLLYVWPLTLLAFVALPGYWDALRLVLLLLAGAAWSRFIFASVRDDYRRFLKNRILELSKLPHVF